jgi:hypothetical protein
VETLARKLDVAIEELREVVLNRSQLTEPGVAAEDVAFYVTRRKALDVAETRLRERIAELARLQAPA